VDEVLTWKAKWKTERLPSKHSHDRDEKCLNYWFVRLLQRRFKSLKSGARWKPLEQLSEAEIALVNSVPGVLVSGCATPVAAEKLVPMFRQLRWM